MARRKPKHSNTSWGREAEWEDIEKLAEPERKRREPDVYQKTFTTAKKMIKNGSNREKIEAALDVPAEPPFMTQDGTVSQRAKVARSVEESMVYVRKKAIEDALASGNQKNSK